MISKDSALQLAFSMYEGKGVYALLLGSGLSRAAGIPTGWEITTDLIRRVAKAQAVPEQLDWAEWYRKTYGKEPNYSDLLEGLAVSPAERRAILHSYIDPSEEDRKNGLKVPTPAHRSIAKLVAGGYVRVLITTNFDPLIETALRELAIEPTIISSVDALIGAEPLTHSRCYLLKIHGDFKDARILNTEAELSSYPAQYNALLDRIFDEYGLVVCGWSGEWDEALRTAILRAPNRRYTTFWAVRGEVGPRAEELIRLRAARVIEINSADSFFYSIEHQVQAIAESHRVHPLSIELLVAQAKQFVPHPETRIQLETVVAEETNRAISLLQGPEFSCNVEFTADGFRQRLGRYETAVEGLASMAGVIGRWGKGGEEYTLVLNVIETLRQHADTSEGGLVWWLDLRRYPAVLVFTGFLLGLIRAERWTDIHHLLSKEVYVRSANQNYRLVELLYHETLGDDPLWRNAEGQEQKITPASNHIFKLFNLWHGRFAPLTPDFERIFDLAETLCAIVHSEKHTNNDLQVALQQQGTIWMPIGRVHLRGRRVAETLLSEKMTSALLKAGFADGERERLDSLLSYFTYQSGRMKFSRR